LKALKHKDICHKCGECCSSLIEGVKVTDQEWQALEAEVNNLQLSPAAIRKAKHDLRLPAKGTRFSKKCVFLTDMNTCMIYKNRPEECRRFPVWLIESRAVVTVVVSHVCPQAERIAVYITEALPDWAREIVNNRSYRVVAI